MPVNEILTGLKFAKSRWHAKDAGTLKVGRKSIVQKEVHSVTTEQAQWRLKNWKKTSFPAKYLFLNTAASFPMKYPGISITSIVLCCVSALDSPAC